MAIARGTTWEPIPGRAHIEVKSHFPMKDDDEIFGAGPVVKESKPWRICITRHDIAKDKYGLTVGCRGCEAINRGQHGQPYERCKARIEKGIIEKDPERFNRVFVKLIQMTEEGTKRDERERRQILKEE